LSPLDPEVPPAGEEIHLPGPTALPAITALGVTLLLVGITTYIELVVIGALITLFATIRWIKDTRREVDELPLDAHADR
jgi:hypothetical protein